MKSIVPSSSSGIEDYSHRKCPTRKPIILTQGRCTIMDHYSSHLPLGLIQNSSIAAAINLSSLHPIMDLAGATIPSQLLTPQGSEYRGPRGGTRSIDLGTR